MQEKKCPWLKISSGGIKDWGGRITDLVQENRLRFRKTKIKRDLARCWNAFKSMQITDKGKGISWKDKTMHLRTRQKISYRTKHKKKKKPASILRYKLAKSTKFLENVLKNVH